VPADVFNASLLAPTIGDPAGLSAAITDVMRLAGAESATRISLALPDIAARVFLVDLAELPVGRAQAEEVVRFRIKKSIPFRPEESRVSWDVVGRDDEGRVQVLVAVAPENAVRPLETLLQDLGLRCGLIDLSTFGVFNALRLDGQLDGGDGEDSAVLSATPSYFSVVLLRGGRLIFFRAKSYHAQGGFRGEESLNAVNRELRSTLGYYDEHLHGQGVKRTYVRVAGVPAEGLLELVESVGCGEVRRAALKTIVPELHRASPEDSAELLPAVGLALRRHA
jgi:hypothetical protein